MLATNNAAKRIRLTPRTSCAACRTKSNATRSTSARPSTSTSSKKRRKKDQYVFSTDNNRHDTNALVYHSFEPSAEDPNLLESNQHRPRPLQIKKIWAERFQKIYSTPFNIQQVPSKLVLQRQTNNKNILRNHGSIHRQSTKQRTNFSIIKHDFGYFAGNFSKHISHSGRFGKHIVSRGPYDGRYTPVLQNPTARRQWGTRRAEKEEQHEFLEALDSHRSLVDEKEAKIAQVDIANSYKARDGHADASRPFSGVDNDTSDQGRTDLSEAPSVARAQFADSDVKGRSQHPTQAQEAEPVLPSFLPMEAATSTSAESEFLDRHRSVDQARWRPRLFAQSKSAPVGARMFHTSARARQHAAAAAGIAEHDMVSPAEEIFGMPKKAHKYSRIRQDFRQWQQMNGNPLEDTKPQPVFDSDEGDLDGVLNSMTRLPEASAAARQNALEEEEERAAMLRFSASDSRDGLAESGADEVDNTFLQAGDLVELDYVSSERNSVLGVFIRRVPGSDAQFFTMQGRWVFVKEKDIMWSIPRWASKTELAPLFEYLPSPGNAVELDEVMQRASTEDLSVPRSASAPLVRRLTKFFTETQEIYRKHANVLDQAHNILAHESDLRYGSLVSAAATLLQIPPMELPITALYAVRSALARSPLAFNIDRRSHRMTGYLQIRSKEQVRMTEYVRDWLRDWQDDIAKRTQLEAEGAFTALKNHKASRRAQYIYTFLFKVRTIILKSREDRQVLPFKCGNIGISQKRFPIEEGSDATRVVEDTQFNEQDLEIVRFMEAWCASGVLIKVASYSALPSMILQATGLYEQFEVLDQGVGFTFLQEIGVMMPFENRVRFHQHLLLPSSQHSKPLQTLMKNLIEMQSTVKFTDSMRELRKDWKDLPVYCIDDAGAQEIDDGISVERIEGKEGEYWLHAHVANPTAFFERDHPLAKMARHMGESIYMPERAYMMLPRWATKRHFSLAKNRPSITFSTRVDSDSNVLEIKVTPGIIRNVHSLTPSEVTTLLGESNFQAEKLVLTVGGNPPPEKKRASKIDSVTEDMVQDLKLMKKLTDTQYRKRMSRGGFFFDSAENEISVWQNFKGQGLNWDHPYRLGSRTTLGDPVLQLKTSGFTNWFAPKISAGSSLTREMMLMAGETAATWCADRGIPTVFRGTTARPDTPDQELFYRDVVEPALQEQGELPSYLGIRYFHMMGRSTLRTTPISHRVAGLLQYVKATSPLRRYGDMIVHWQIEAALREEAKRGRSLTPADTSKDSSFLPFSANVLNTIMTGLQPREMLITRSKSGSRDFWMNMLFFRAHHFNECELPFAATHAEVAATGKPLMQIFLYTPITDLAFAMGISITLNTTVMMMHPTRAGLEAPVRGDTWEVEVDYVDVYRRTIMAKPVRLVDRPVDANLERWRHIVP